MAISGKSNTLSAFDIEGDPIGEAIPYDNGCSKNRSLIKSITFGEDHLQSPYINLAKALNLIDKYGTALIAVYAKK